MRKIILTYLKPSYDRLVPIAAAIIEVTNQAKPSLGTSVELPTSLGNVSRSLRGLVDARGT